MNAFHNTVKYLKVVNIKSVLSKINHHVPIHLNNLPKDNINLLSKAKSLTFNPHNITITNINESKTKKDPLSYIPVVNPRSILPLIEDNNWSRGEIGLPSIKKEEMQANRMLRIRKKKMKKHQRNKLWKRMRHRWAKVKQHRRQRKEKKFQAELLAMIKEAEEFSAEQYVSSKLEQANYVPIPTTWRHKRLPQFIIRQLIGLDKRINYKRTDVYQVGPKYYK